MAGTGDRWFYPFRHAGLKLVSVALAVSLWMAVSGEEVVERGLRVPLELQQFPAGLELSGEPPIVVDVRVRGGSGALSRISTGEVVAVLDLRGVRPGRRLFQVTPEDVRVPFGVEVVQVTPSTVTMVFEASATRQVPVVADIEGTPAPGFVVGKVTIDPARVDVTGPESAVARVAEALTEPVSIEDARQTVMQTVTVGLLDPLLRLKSPRPATVYVEVLPGPRERTVSGLPVHLRNLDPALSAQAMPSAVDVIVRGTREGVSRIGPGDLTASVDVAGLGVGEYSVPVEVEVAKDAGVDRIMPSTVQVRISRAKN
jgi:YbbR domain-containing protein